MQGHLQREKQNSTVTTRLKFKPMIELYMHQSKYFNTTQFEIYINYDDMMAWNKSLSFCISYVFSESIILRIFRGIRNLISILTRDKV